MSKIRRVCPYSYNGFPFYTILSMKLCMELISIDSTSCFYSDFDTDVAVTWVPKLGTHVTATLGILMVRGLKSIRKVGSAVILSVRESKMPKN